MSDGVDLARIAGAFRVVTDEMARADVRAALTLEGMTRGGTRGRLEEMDGYLPASQTTLPEGLDYEQQGPAIEVYDNGVLKLTNPGGMDYRYGLDVIPQGDGFLLDVMNTMPCVQLLTTGVWLGAHDGLPMRNPTSAAFTLAANILYGTIMVVPERSSASSVGFRVTTAGAAGALARFGIYKLDFSDSSMDLYLQSGTIDVTSTGWKQTDFAWPVTAPGIYLNCLVGNAAFSVNGIAANALAASPFPMRNYDPATGYVVGNAPPIPQGVLRSTAFGSLPSTIALSAANIVTSALPVVMVFMAPS